MRTSEWLVIGYLAYLTAIAWLRPIGQSRRLMVIATALVQAGAVWALSAAPGATAGLARDWAPVLHLLVAYWLSGAYFVRPMVRLESALAACDRAVFDVSGIGDLVRHGPRWMLEYLELAYLGVYLMVPGGFAVAYFGSTGFSVDTYWTVVLAAGLVSYGMLPWLQTRPPTALGLDRDVEARGLWIRGLNQRILRRGSIHVNTVPSGHASTAVATALAAGAVVPGALVPLAVAAISITVASAVARYHYVVDAVLGVLVAVVVWGVVH